MTSPSIAQTIENWPIERLVEYPRNPRKNGAAVDGMCASIREFGFKIPILARSDRRQAQPFRGPHTLVRRMVSAQRLPFLVAFGSSAAEAGAVPVSGVDVMLFSPLAVITVTTSITPVSQVYIRQMAVAMKRRWR